MKIEELRAIAEAAEGKRPQHFAVGHRRDVAATHFPALLKVAEAAKKDLAWHDDESGNCDGHPKPSTCTTCVFRAALRELEEVK